MIAYADEDIDFCRFDWNDFHKKWSLYKPIVFQPTIVPNTQDFWVFNAQSFATVRNKSIFPTDYIEQQITFMDSQFAVHFWKYFGCTIGVYQDRESGDWGLDRVWCLIAAAWAPKRLSCAVILSSVHHDDTKTIHKTRGFIRSNIKILELIKKRYNNVFLPYERRKMYKGKANLSLVHSQSM